MNDEEIIKTNRTYWDEHADLWYGTTALPQYGVRFPTEDDLHLFGDIHLTQDEIEDFHLSTLKLHYDEALAEYEKCSSTRLGRLVANREVPVLKRAKDVLDVKE